MSSRKRFHRATPSRVPFFGSIAKEHGVRLSALVCHIVNWSRNKYRLGKLRAEYDPCEAFGVAIGVKVSQVYRLLRLGKEAGLLDFKKGLNCTRVWLTDDSLYAIPSNDQFHYDRDLADLFGINGAILLGKIAFHTLLPEYEGQPGYRAGYIRFINRFPWMTEPAVKAALYRLRRLKQIDWDDDNCNFTSHRYFVPALMNEHLIEGEPPEARLRAVLGLPPDSVPFAPPPGSHLRQAEAPANTRKRVKRAEDRSLDDWDDASPASGGCE